MVPDSHRRLSRMLAERNRDLVKAVDCLKAELRHQQLENNDLHARWRMTMRERNAAQDRICHRIQDLAHELAACHQLVLDLQHKLYGSRGAPKITSDAFGSLVGRRRVGVNCRTWQASTENTSGWCFMHFHRSR